MSESVIGAAKGRWKHYPAYYETATPLVGALPGAWPNCKLKYLLAANDGGTWGEDFDDEGTIVLRSTDMGVRGNWHLSDPARRCLAPSERRAAALKTGDLVVTKSSGSELHLGKTAIVTPELEDLGCCFSNFMQRLRTGSRLSSNFLWWVLNSTAGREQMIVNGSTTTGLANLSGTVIGETVVPVPAPSEQRAIVAFLDRETSRIDALIAQKERLIALLDEKRQSVISHAVSRGLDPDVPMKDSGIEWLGMVPSHWTLLALKRLARTGYKTFTDGDWIESPYITDEGVRLIQTGNIGTGAYKEQGHRFVSEETFRELNCTRVDPRDVLICRLDGPVGRACLAPDLGCRMITSVDVTILKPAHNCDARYLVYLLTVPTYLEWVASLCRVGGGHRWRVSRTMLGDFTVPMPPKAEQTAIADHLDKHTRKLLEAIQLLQQHISMMGEYRTALISAAVTGQIDVRGEVTDG